MSKDLEWLKEEVASRRKGLGEIRVLDDDNVYANGGYNALLEVERLIDQVEQPETLSQEWIDDHKVARVSNLRKMTMSDVVPVESLENMLMPKQELPVIPNYVAEYIENEKESEVTLEETLENMIDPEYQVIDIVKKTSEYFKDNIISFIDAYRYGYTVEEKKYYVRLKVITDEFVPSYLRSQTSDAEDKLKALEIGSRYIHEDYQHLSEFTEDELKRLNIWDSEQWEVEELEE